MLRPSEDLLQYLWEHRLLEPVPLRTISNLPVRVLSPGTINRDAGPDFFNAQVEIDGVLLSGNVEIHIRTSDWSRHNHESDRSYDHIILHVVYEHDATIRQNAEHGVEVLELRNYIPDEILARYESLALAPSAIPCARQLAGVDDFKFSAWLERMAVERIEYKQQKIARLLHEFHGDYGQVLYALLLPAYGFNVNALPFELVARHLPVQILLRHSNNLLHLEALLTGIAGMLGEQLEHCWLRSLQNEFAFLQRKYKLLPLKRSLLKFSRMRPANFPGLRLAQLAALIHKHSIIFTDPAALRSREELISALQAEVSPYWRHHYSTSGGETSGELRMGVQAAENIILNVFAPFLYFCGRKFGKEQLVAKALQLLEDCAPEDNRKTRLFSAKIHLCTSAMQSQALINLCDHYCSAKKCLQCAVGTHIISGARHMEKSPVIR